jgi:hypothetical protein
MARYSSIDERARVWQPKPLSRELLSITVILVLQSVSPWSGAATFVVLTAWALRSSQCSIQALSLGVLISFASHAFVPAQHLVPLFRWVLLFAALARVTLDDPSRPRPSAKWVLMLGLFFSVSFAFAILVSHDPVVSLLKLFSFGMGALVCLASFRDRRISKRYFLNWFYTLHIAVLALSLPAMFIPAGYVGGFQGILSQPQTLGVYLVPMTAYLTALVVAGYVEKTSALVCVLSWYMTIASACRTAVLAICVALLVATCIAMVSSKLTRVIRPVALLSSAVVVIALALSMLVGSNEVWIQRVEHFVTKQQQVGGDGTLASVISTGWSRGEQVDRSLKLVGAHPFAGVGFGLDSEDRDLADGADTMLGAPLTTATEPGFIYTAIPAQVGLVGASVFFFFLASLFRPILASYRFPVMVAALAGLCVNNGEMIILSMGGLGLHLWLVLAWAYESCLKVPVRVRVQRHSPH